MITAAQALYIVRERIEEIRSAKTHCTNINSPEHFFDFSAEDRALAATVFQNRIEEFGYHWPHVERILHECLKEGIEP
jgi:hypothetical protein